MPLVSHSAARQDFFSLPITRLLCGLLCATLSAFSMSQEGAYNAADKTPLPVRFATTSVKPWGIQDDLRDQGLLVAVIDELVKMTKIPVANELQPYPRVVHSLYSGYVDFAFLFDSPSTEASAIRIGHLVDSKMIVVGRAGEKELSSLSELAGRSVGFIRGAKYGVAFDEATHFQRVPVSTMEQGLAMMMRHRMDVMAGTDQALYWSMRKMNVGAKRLTKLYVLQGTSGSLYLSKKSNRTDLIPVYREALLKLKENGTIDRIFHSDYQWAATGRISGTGEPVIP